MGLWVLRRWLGSINLSNLGWWVIGRLVGRFLRLKCLYAPYFICMKHLVVDPQHSIILPRAIVVAC